jgi:hypothetical protein
VPTNQLRAKSFFHWNNAQATIHPFMAYYSQNKMIEHISFVVTSDCLKYDIVAVHLFHSKLCSFLSGKLKDLTRIYYFSDGVASQNKTGKISPSSAIIKMILVWMLNGTSLQHHMAKVHVMGLGEQLKD